MEEMNERRAPVQRTPKMKKESGTIAWWEHVEAWKVYDKGSNYQSAERIAERGGFSYGELIKLLGHEPVTWTPRRAPVQRTPGSGKREGTIAWWEHVEAWETYHARNNNNQSAERIAERGGFSYGELPSLLGHEPTTWMPR